MALGHSILVIAWHLLANDCDYQDLGGDFFVRRDVDRARQRAVAQLQASATASPRTTCRLTTGGFTFQDEAARSSPGQAHNTGAELTKRSSVVSFDGDYLRGSPTHSGTQVTVSTQGLIGPIAVPQSSVLQATGPGRTQAEGGMTVSSFQGQAGRSTHAAGRSTGHEVGSCWSTATASTRPPEYVTTALNAAGWSAYGLDHVGHGRSEGERVLIPDFTPVVEDVHTVVGQAKAANPCCRWR